MRAFGRIARYISRYASAPDDPRVAAFFTEALRRAQQAQADTERDEVISRIRSAIEVSELSQADFAKEIGTSASRLSTCLSGQVMPSAAMLVRIENVGVAHP